MPFKWFRRQKPEREQAPPEAAAPVVEVPEEPAARAAVTSTVEAPATPKRRRGTRGGKGRKKPESGPAKEKEKAEPVRSQAEERRAQQRKDRAARGEKRRPAPRRAPLPAAKRDLLVSVDVGEQRVAVLEDDRVAEVYLERPERRSIAGNVYLGVVDNVLPGMEAAFVEIGLERNGFLYVDEIVRPSLEGHRQGKRIQDLLSRGEQILVQAVKDPMKSKGARLTMEISLPGRFVVFVPNGEGLGVSRRLEDDERTRLKDILKALNVKQGGVIVRTAAEGASADDIERDLVFLQKLWKTIEAQAKTAKAPTLVYQEAELPLRVTRDLFTENFTRALVDDEKTFKRVTGYLKKTSPHMVERVTRYKEKDPLFERYGVDAEIRSTLSRRVDLPSGGYLIFDYAEAFTVIDVNTGRFVGSRSKTSASRLEDTITKNNLEAVKEVVRQLRLRDIGGIIVIDFIDMANPKNRQAVEDALRNELERDRTKTYVVEISPLGLVEMTRQNVTEGPREILTRKCPTCGGDGVVISEQSAAIDLERRLRALAHGSRVQAFRIEVNASVAARLIGPGAVRLQEIEAASRRRFFLVPKEDVHFDHFLVAQQGKLEALAPQAPFEEGATIDLQPVQVGLHDSKSAVAKRDGYDIVVANGAGFVGKKVKAQITRVLPGTAYATIVKKTKDGAAPITAEGEAEKPTRKAAARKPASAKPDAVVGADTADAVEPDAVVSDATASDDDTAESPPKKKTRRGSRGGRKHKKAPTIHVPETELGANGAEPEPQLVAEEPAVAEQPVADETIAEEPEAQVAENGAGGDAPAADAGETPKKKTRRGSRGGRNRRKKPAAAAPAETTESS
ncbi:MAG: Rne/Rng family ribonuclease [Gaiellaceae bacterium]